MAATVEADLITEANREVVEDTMSQFRMAATTLTRDLFLTNPQFWATKMLDLSEKTSKLLLGTTTSYVNLFRTAEGATQTITQFKQPVFPAQQAKATIYSGIARARKDGMFLETQTPDEAIEMISNRVAGRLALPIQEPARDYVQQVSVHDPDARGWARVTDGSPCDFCAMLATRGGVYTEKTARFQAHPHCACSVELIYDGWTPSPSQQVLDQRNEEAYQRIAPKLAAKREEKAQETAVRRAERQAAEEAREQREREEKARRRAQKAAEAADRKRERDRQYAARKRAEARAAREEAS